MSSDFLLTFSMVRAQMPALLCDLCGPSVIRPHSLTLNRGQYLLSAFYVGYWAKVPAYLPKSKPPSC